MPPSGVAGFARGIRGGSIPLVLPAPEVRPPCRLLRRKVIVVLTPAYVLRLNLRSTCSLGVAVLTLTMRNCIGSRHKPLVFMYACICTCTFAFVVPGGYRPARSQTDCSPSCLVGKTGRRDHLLADRIPVGQVPDLDPRSGFTTVSVVRAPICDRSRDSLSVTVPSPVRGC